MEEIKNQTIALVIPEIRKTVKIETELLFELDLSDFEEAEDEDDFDDFFEDESASFDEERVFAIFSTVSK